MQPDLRPRHVTSLRFSASLDLGEDLVSRIRTSSPPDDEGDSLFVDSYKRHRAIVWVQELDKDAGTFLLGFTYEPVPGGGLRKLVARVHQLVDIVAPAGEQLDFDCQVAFQFGKRLKPRSIITLPMKYIEAPGLPFDSIQGLHFTKADDSGTKYDVFLDAPAHGVLAANVLFKYATQIDQSLPERILSEAESICQKFVSWERKDARKTE